MSFRAARRLHCTRQARIAPRCGTIGGVLASDDVTAEVREAVARVCAKFDDTYWAACDEEHRFPDEFYDAMAAGGWIGIAIPEEYGGGGQGITQAAAVLEEVAASGACMNGA